MSTKHPTEPSATPTADELHQRLTDLEGRLARHRERLDKMTDEERRGVGSFLESISEDMENNGEIVRG